MRYALTVYSDEGNVLMHANVEDSDDLITCVGAFERSTLYEEERSKETKEVIPF